MKNEQTENSMPLWKRLALISAASGAGFAVALSTIVGGFAWYASRPKPWNTSALKATFERLDVKSGVAPLAQDLPPPPPGFIPYPQSRHDDFTADSEATRLLFHYVLENTANLDYRLPDAESLMVMLKRAAGTLKRSEYEIKFDSPVFIPAKQRADLTMNMFYTIDYQAVSDRAHSDKPSKIEDLVRKYGGRVAFDPVIHAELVRDPSAFLKKYEPDLDMVVIFDETSRYQINLPMPPRHR